MRHNTLVRTERSGAGHAVNANEESLGEGEGLKHIAALAHRVLLLLVSLARVEGLLP